MTFSELLKQARLKKKMTKGQVAALFGWTPMYYGRYENDKLFPTNSNIGKFAKFIGISEKELILIVEKEKNSNPQHQ